MEGGTKTRWEARGSKSPACRWQPGPLRLVAWAFAVALGAAAPAHAASVFCAGSGPLGDGSAADSNVPVPVRALSDVISLGLLPPMAVKSDGTVWRWGEGTGEPVQVPGLDHVVAVTGSELSHVSKLALKADGTVWHWSDDQPVPAQVVDPADPTGFLTRVTAVASGARTHYALKSDGTVWAWGVNFFWDDERGLLGDGTTADSPVPVRCLNLSDVKAIAADRSHALALGADGRVWAWGGNAYGQLGDGTFGVRLEPTPVFPAEGTSPGAVAIAASAYSSYAVRADGTVWSCGENSNGQLGDGTTESRSTWARVGELTGAVSVVSGENAWIALVRKADGSMWGWGLNDHGHLGCGGNGDVLLPCRVRAPWPAATGYLGGVVAAATDVNRTCFLTVDEPLHVAAIDLAATWVKRSVSATATVKVNDDLERPVADAVVTGRWYAGETASSVVGTTGPDGTVALTSPGVRGNDRVLTFLLDSVAKAGMFLDGSQSVLTGSITARR